VRADLAEFVPATAELAVTSILIAYLLGITLGVISAVRRNHLATTCCGWYRLAASRCPPSGSRSSPCTSSSSSSAGCRGAAGSTRDPCAPHVTGLLTVDALFSGQFDVLTNGPAAPDPAGQRARRLQRRAP